MNVKDDRKTVGYVRSYLEGEDCVIACNMQKTMIDSYAVSQNLVCELIYTDMGSKPRRSAKDREKAKKIGMNPHKDVKTFSAWDELMIAIIDGTVGAIVVDNIMRLYNALEQKKVTERILLEYNVMIYIAGDLHPSSEGAVSIACYHYTIQKKSKQIRNCIPLNDVDSLYVYASKHKNWEITGVYLDVKSSNRTEYPKLLNELDEYSAVLVKSLYHFNRKMMPFLAESKRFRNKGKDIYSQEEGKFIYSEFTEDRFNKPLKVALYDWQRSEQEAKEQDILMKKVNAFTRLKSDNNWTITGKYIDKIGSHQNELKRLIKASGQYDLILVDTFVKLGDTIIWLARVLNAIDIPIYSLREGGIKLDDR